MMGRILQSLLREFTDKEQDYTRHHVTLSNKRKPKWQFIPVIVLDFTCQSFRAVAYQTTIVCDHTRISVRPHVSTCQHLLHNDIISRIKINR